MKSIFYHISFLLLITVTSVSAANDNTTEYDSMDRAKEVASEAYESSKKAAGAAYEAGDAMQKSGSSMQK